MTGSSFSGRSAHPHGVDFANAGIFEHHFRLVVAQAIDFVGDLVIGIARDENAHQFFAAEAHVAARNGCRLSGVYEKDPRGFSILDFRFSIGRRCVVGEELPPGRGRRGSRERCLLMSDTRMVSSDPVGQQAADADGALDTAILSIAGFGNAEMHGVIPVRSSAFCDATEGRW